MADIINSVTPGPFIDGLSQGGGMPWLGNLKWWQLWLATGGVIGGALGQWGKGQRGVVKGAAVGAFVSLVGLASFYTVFRTIGFGGWARF